VQFSALAAAWDTLEQTAGRREMIARLAELLARLGRDEVGPVVYLSQGRLAPIFEPVEIGLGERAVAGAIARAAGVEGQRVAGEYARLGDLGRVAEQLLDRPAPASDATPVLAVYSRLRAIADATGSGSAERKLELFVELLRAVEPRSARFLCRIALGRLRLGIGDPTILDALSRARTGVATDRAVLERAYNLTSDLGLVARRYVEGGAAAVAEIRVQVGRPIRPALAERLPSPEAVVERLGRCAVEPKYDGLRCQAHKRGDQVRVFSRNLEDMTGMFPELVLGVQRQIAAGDAILDGEAVAYDPASDRYRPFQQTTRRRRKHGVAEMAQTLPLRFFAFDLMLLEAADLTPLPMTERRARLERALRAGETLRLAPQTVTDDPAALRAQLLHSVAEGLEGVMAKKLDAPYQAGGRSLSWVKLKRNVESQLQDTVDCVILGYDHGRGKRAALGAGALLVGVYDQARDEFATISRIGTGLSDRDWREVRARCDQIALDHRPARVRSLVEPSVWVEPRVVVEVLADEITRSPVHTAGRDEQAPGFALRFPRLVRFRQADKRPEDATTVEEIRGMYARQGGGAN
jgi:DNA ligase-1